LTTRKKASSAKPIRNGVRIPATLADPRCAADAEAEQPLKAAHRNFVAETDPGRKNEAERDLISAIFGKDSIAEDSVF
jgi:hypothetical protein